MYHEKKNKAMEGHSRDKNALEDFCSQEKILEHKNSTRISHNLVGFLMCLLTFVIVINLIYIHVEIRLLSNKIEQQNAELETLRRMQLLEGGIAKTLKRLRGKGKVLSAS